jgi:dipeptidyl aminopeptidase/acylaminoacyl peptidase
MTLVGTGLTLEKTLEKNDIYTKYAVNYLSNGLRITGVFLIPNEKKPHQLLVFNHGYIDPAVYTQGRGLKREEDYMARHGFAVFHPDYRGHAGSDKSPMTEQVYDGNLEYAMDSANAIHALREAKIPNVDASKVGMFGHSMGGGVTLAILTGKPELIDAAVLYAPVHAKVWENFVRWRAKREEGDRTITQFGSYEEHPEKWDALSPDTFLSEIKVPVMLFQGTNDRDVPHEWSEYLNTRLKNLGKNITFIEYEGEGHEFSPKWTDFMEKTAAFFSQELR